MELNVYKDPFASHQQYKGDVADVSPICLIAAICDALKGF